VTDGYRGTDRTGMTSTEGTTCNLQITLKVCSSYHHFLLTLRVGSNRPAGCLTAMLLTGCMKAFGRLLKYIRHDACIRGTVFSKAHSDTVDKRIYAILLSKYKLT